MTETEKIQLERFFYILMRDYITSGTVHEIIHNNQGAVKELAFSNPYLLSDVQNCIQAIIQGVEWSPDLAQNKEKENSVKIKIVYTPTIHHNIPGYLSKITAIKIHRTLTSFALKESKIAIETDGMIHLVFYSEAAACRYITKRIKNPDMRYFQFIPVENND